MDRQWTILMAKYHREASSSDAGFLDGSEDSTEPALASIRSRIPIEAAECRPMMGKRSLRMIVEGLYICPSQNDNILGPVRRAE